MMRTAGTLIGGASVVIVAVTLLAAVVLPGSEVGSGHQTSTTTGTTAGMTVEDRLNAGIEVTGDREGTFHANESWRVSGDFASGFYLDQMVFDGLNIFPEPEDCPLEVTEVRLMDSLVALRVDCTVRDISGNSMIHLDGYTHGPLFDFLPPPSDDSGGTLRVSGDFESESTTGPIAWYVSASDPDDQIVLTGHQETLDYQGFGGGDAGFSLDTDGNLVLGYFFGSSGSFGHSFNPEPGECAISVDEVEMVSETMERLTVGIDCPSVQSDTFEGSPPPATVSASGTVVIDRITVELPG